MDTDKGIVGSHLFYRIILLNLGGGVVIVDGK